jgi:xanthine dehydrogenase accessory factor
VAIKGAGEMASGVAWRLYRAGFTRLFLLELPRPMSVRRRVSFSVALYDGGCEVEGVTAVAVQSADAFDAAWSSRTIPVLADPDATAIRDRTPDVLVDAVIAKRNLGTTRSDAPLVIALGPGFHAGVDAHVVIVTNRGHDLGRILTQGADEPNTGVPGEIAGHSWDRVMRAPADGTFHTPLDIGSPVVSGYVVGVVDGVAIHAGVGGIVRGLLRSGTEVTRGLKLGDIDPRHEPRYCSTVSDKSRAIAGSVLEAILGATARS